MPSVAALTAPYGNLLLAPRRGPGVCETCFNLTDGYDHCYACTHAGNCVDVVAPISYSVAGEQLHHALAAYKRSAAPWARELGLQLAAVLWRHLAGHERCLATRAGAGADRFPVVTAVPSGDPARPEPHPLAQLLAEVVGPTRDRFTPLLRRSARPLTPRSFSPDRFVARRRLDGEPVLLVDDTWTSGASAQSATATLKRAGAGPVAVLVIGRHLNRDWGANDARLRGLPTPFDWSRCPWCPR